MDDKHRLLKNVDVAFSECNHRSLKGHAKGWNCAFMVVATGLEEAFLTSSGFCLLMLNQ